MDFPNERYVRLYTRETTTWRLLGWEGQALLPQVLRLVDRSGVLDLAHREQRRKPQQLGKALVDLGLVTPEKLITHREPLDHWERVFDDLEQLRGLKGLLIP